MNLRWNMNNLPNDREGAGKAFNSNQYSWEWNEMDDDYKGDELEVEYEQPTQPPYRPTTTRPAYHPTPPPTRPAYRPTAPPPTRPAYHPTAHPPTRPAYHPTAPPPTRPANVPTTPT